MFGIVLLQSMARTPPGPGHLGRQDGAAAALIFLLPLWWGRDGVLLAQPATVLLLTPPLCWLGCASGVSLAQGKAPCHPLRPPMQVGEEVMTR